jgi:hypothetical protein
MKSAAAVVAEGQKKDQSIEDELKWVEENVPATLAET